MKIKIDGKIKTLPESWEEVPLKKRDALFGLLLILEPKKVKEAALFNILGIPKGMFLSIKHQDIAAMEAQMHWFNLDASATPVLPYFEENKTRYYFPKPDFQNGTALEFLMIQDLYSEFVATEYPQNIGVLQRMAAVLCRELDKKTKKRVILQEDDEALEARNTVFKKLQTIRATMVLKYVQGVLGLIEETGLAFDIFNPPTPENTEGEQETNVNIFGWKSVFRSVAEIGSYGTYNDVLQRPFWDIIEILAEREALRKAQQELIDDAKGNKTVSD